MGRRLAIAASVLVVGAFSGCDCAGCSSTEAASAVEASWAVTISCNSTTRIGAVGAAHAGGVIYPDGCAVEWKLRARGKNQEEWVNRTLVGAVPAGHACSETKAFCKSTKAQIVSRKEGDDVVVAVAAGAEAQGLYLFEPGGLIMWSGAAGAEDAGAFGDVRTKALTGDAAALLAAMPPAEVFVTRALEGAASMDNRFEAVLVGPRLERHFGEVRAALRACRLPESFAQGVLVDRPDVLAEIYAAALDTGKPCGDYERLLVRVTPPALEPLVIRDLEACRAKCPPERLRSLAALAFALGSKPALHLVADHLDAPTAKDWERDEDAARSALVAWYASAYAVGRHLPAEARPKLLAQFGAWKGADPDGVDAYEVVPVEPRSPVLDGGKPRDTLQRLAELLLVVDDASVRAAMAGFAADRKRDRGVRQTAIGYLVAVRDPRGRALQTSDALTPEQRTIMQKTLDEADAGASDQ